MDSKQTKNVNNHLLHQPCSESGNGGCLPDTQGGRERDVASLQHREWHRDDHLMQ